MNNPKKHDMNINSDIQTRMRELRFVKMVVTV